MASISTTAIIPPPLPPISSTTNVHFPCRQWVTLDAKWTLTLVVTAELAWDQLGSTPNSTNPGVFRNKRVAAARVVELVRAGRLWIDSSGRRVDLVVRPMLGGMVVGNSHINSEDGVDSVRELFHETILEWPLWEDKLGLRVRSRSAESAEMRPGDDTTLLYFTVNHPPSPSGLYAPSRAGGGIPQARLERVFCQLNINYCAEGFKIPRVVPAAKKSKVKAKPTSKSKSKKRARPSKPKKKPTPRSNLRPRQSEAACRQQQQMVDGPRNELVVGSPAWRQATALIMMSLHVLMGTAGKTPPVPGIRPVDDVSAPSGAPSLLDVAPAVWSNHYFTTIERPPDLIDDDDQLIDLCFDNLEAIFSQSQDDNEGPPREWGDYMEGDTDDEDDIEAQELDWGDIEALPEHYEYGADNYEINEYLEEEDGLFEEIDETWSPQDLVYDESQEMEEGQSQQDPYGSQQDPYGVDLSEDEESGLQLWQEMQAWQLDELQDDEESQPMCYDLGYMDDDEDIRFMDIDEADLDEGIGLCRDEHDIIERIC
ncbi:hypothetical protein Sste5346_001858 [Sporothrix stenoceras]|uniref:Uncharacterized protein n=1 Tax=Sporothrix stenoceras TaxID=5173 RepID=A0ABR3ZNN1_9PEZI